MAGYICKIVMEDTHPPVWRRVVIPEKITFGELHEVIQIVFDWQEMHLHAFEIPADYICIDNEEDTWGDHYDEAVTLIDSFFKNYKWIRYIYDFGDDWRHRINIEKIDETYQERHVTLLKAKGDNFMEDSGGIWGYDEEAYRNPFQKQKVERKLSKKKRERHDELEEEPLLKESVENLRDMLERMLSLKSENLNGLMAEALQKMDDDVVQGKSVRNVVGKGEKSMLSKKWKRFSVLTDKCYANMIGTEKDSSCWKQAFDLLMEIVRDERKINPDFSKEIGLLDDETDYEYDILGWLEDCLDETDMRKQYDLLLEMCNELSMLFILTDDAGLDIKFRKSTVLRDLKKVEEAVAFCRDWYETEKDNIVAATAYVYALIDEEEYADAEKMIQIFITDFSECTEDEELMFRAASKYYDVTGNKKKKKEVDKALKEYEKIVDQELLDWIEGDDDEDWDNLPFD